MPNVCKHSIDCNLDEIGWILSKEQVCKIELYQSESSLKI